MPPQGDILLGKIALERGLLSPGQLADCLEEQRGDAGSPLGAILVRRGVVKPADLEALLEEQKRRLAAALDLTDPRLEDALLGRLLIKQGLARESHVYEGLRLQAEAAEEGRTPPRLGEILVARGYLAADAHETAVFLEHRKVFICPACGARFSTLGTDLARKYTCKQCGCILERQEEVLKPGETSGTPRLDVPDDAAEASRDPARKFADGRYILIQEVGRGGMGVVWKAWQTDLKRYVAVKVLAAGLWTEPDIKRFNREAQMAASLSHAHIASIYEIGSWEGKHFIAMEFVDGDSLSQFTYSHGKHVAGRTARHLPPRRAIELVREAAQAVDYAHSKGIMHRDLKPHNIMVSRTDGRVYVMDFGLARPIRSQDSISVSDAIVGTPQYMSPEQARGDPLDRRTDVFSLGAVLYHVLSGRPPFEGRSAAETMMSVLADDPAPLRRLNPRVHADVETICLKALDKDRHRRYDSARSFAEDLTRYLEGEPISARPLTPRERLWKEIRRRPIASALTAAGAVAGILLAVILGAIGLNERARISGLYDQAYAALARDQFEEARMYCDRVLAYDPDHAHALLLRERCEKNIVRRGRELARERQERDERVKDLRERADEWFDEKRYERAAQFYSRILEYDPQDEQARARVEECDAQMARMGEQRGAMEDEVVNLKRELAQLKLEGDVRAQKRIRAMAFYHVARQALEAAARMRVGQGAFTVREIRARLQEAREALNRAVQEDRTYAEAWICRGQVRHRMGDFELAAEVDFTEALQLNPASASAAFGSAMSHLALHTLNAYAPKFARDDQTQARAMADLLEAARLALRSTDSLEHWSAQALEHFAERRHDQAVEALATVAREGRGNYLYHFVLACVQAARADWPAAQRELTAALELEPVALEALYLRAAVRREREDLAGALEDADEAVEAAPPENFLVLLLRAGVHEAQGHREAAVKDLRQAVAIPGSPSRGINLKVEDLEKQTTEPKREP